MVNNAARASVRSHLPRPISRPKPVSTLPPNAGVPIVLLMPTWIGVELERGFDDRLRGRRFA
jgi:hypothetical protein